MNKIIENIKSGHYEIVDNQGVSVTEHFTHCLEKEFADLEAKLAEKEKEIERIKTNYVGGMQNANEATRIFKEQYCKEHQDKISFAVEKLNEVKDLAEKANGMWLDGDAIINYIEEQIKQLKEMK